MDDIKRPVAIITSAPRVSLEDVLHAFDEAFFVATGYEPQQGDMKLRNKFAEYASRLFSAADGPTEEHEMPKSERAFLDEWQAGFPVAPQPAAEGDQFVDDNKIVATPTSVDHTSDQVAGVSKEIHRAIVAALSACIEAHGPISKEWIGSAAKRLGGHLRSIVSPAAAPEGEVEWPTQVGVWNYGADFFVAKSDGWRIKVRPLYGDSWYAQHDAPQWNDGWRRVPPSPSDSEEVAKLTDGDLEEIYLDLKRLRATLAERDAEIAKLREDGATFNALNANYEKAKAEIRDLSARLAEGDAERKRLEACLRDWPAAFEKLMAHVPSQDVRNWLDSLRPSPPATETA